MIGNTGTLGLTIKNIFNIMGQHISFETAKLAKEKGLDLPHTHYYVYPFMNFKADGKLNKNLMPEDYNNNMFQVVNGRKGQPHIAPAYTQSQLKTYLRDIHNIGVESYHDYDPKDKGSQFYTSWGYYNGKEIDGTTNVNGWYDEYNDWKKYEDALEFGLQEGLKLIPAKK